MGQKVGQPLWDGRSMTRTIGRLRALNVTRLKQSGLHGDGGGLYLRVSKAGNKSWIFRYMLRGKARDMGLGAYPEVDLAAARTKAADCRKVLAEGNDPIDARKSRADRAALAEASRMTFMDCAMAYIAAHEASWRNPKHVYQWKQSLQSYAYPVFGKLPVQGVDVGLVLKVLEPIWQTKTETAKRLRGRIEAVLDWAAARKYRTGENPARWKGLLENLLARPSKIARVQHHAALPYTEIGAFMGQLKAMEGVSPLALQFTILTAARTSEALCATWEEIDITKGIWTVPAHRIKAGREHRVPLSAQAVAILETLQLTQTTPWIFPSTRRGKPLSNMALLATLKRLQRQDLTAHGFRSTFRDWCAEQTNYPSEVAEAALAHTIGDKVEAAYRRGDLFEKRRQLMEAWARYANAPNSDQRRGKVLAMQIA